MKENAHVFTIMAGCVPVGAQMLLSYNEFHNEKINVYLFESDFLSLSEADLPIFKNVVLHPLSDDLKNDFSQGHLGTAKVWAQVIRDNPEAYLIHIDSDVIFKKESLSLIEKAGYPDIYGSRRCYKNNPVGIPVADGIEDAISTYFMAVNAKLIDSARFNQIDLTRLCQGAYNPLDFPVFDFFDPVFFHMRNNGATVYYEDSDIIGGQNELGSKKNKYPSNMHLDMGSHIAHFGGVGSGYASSKDNSLWNKNYSEWAIWRWWMFRDMMINGIKKFDPSLKERTIYDKERWVSGGPDKNIWDSIVNDLNN